VEDLEPMGGAKAVKGHHVLVVGVLLVLGAMGCSSKQVSAPPESPGAAPFVGSTGTTSRSATTIRSSTQTFGPTDPSHAEFCSAFGRWFTFGPLDTADDPELFTARLSDRLAILDELAGFAPPEVRTRAIAVREAMARAKNGQDIDELLRDPSFQESVEVLSKYTVHCSA